MRTRIVQIERLDLLVRPFGWDFATKRRPEIDAYFAAEQRRKAGLWNGRVLLLSEYAITDAVFRGVFFETDFASFTSWRAWGFPDASAINCFALGALQGSDGSYVLGVMGAHTANAGKVYFPGGTPDLQDIADGRVDLESNVRREVAEETGLVLSELDIGPGWDCILAGPMIGLMKSMRAAEPAAVLCERIRQNLARERHPELADVVVAHGPTDIQPRMPQFMQDYLRAAFEGHLAKPGATA